MSHTSRPMTDDERRLFAAEIAREALVKLRKMVRILDGLEWAHATEGLIAELETIERGCRRYATHT